VKRLLATMSLLVLLTALVPASVGAHDVDWPSRLHRMQQRIERLQARVGVIEQELDVQGAAASELSEQLQAVRTINQNQTRSIVDLWGAIDELRGEHPDEPDHPHDPDNPPCGPCPPDDEAHGGLPSATCGC